MSSDGSAQLMVLTLDKAFDPRHNSIGFLRWFLALAVIFSHAGPLAGFYGSKNLGTQWSDEQSFGGVAVAGFFFLSGFLITKSRRGKSTVFRYFWRRGLRIFPAFWAALLLTAFVLAPIAWWHVNGTLSGYFGATTDSPLTYFSNNMFLRMKQENIAGMGQGLPLSQCCGYDWNGSAWTLIYEFKGYVLIGVMGVFGLFGYRTIASLAFLGQLLLNSLTFLGVNANIAILDPLMSNFFNVMLLTPFFFGMMFALWGDKIPIDDRIAAAAAAIAIFTYFLASGWNVYGQFAFLYLVMWTAVRLPLRNWEKHGDLSYGVYIYAWPIQQFGAFFQIEKLGWFGYHAVVILACHIAAYASWHLIEKQALNLKNWTPRWLSHLLRQLRPVKNWLSSRLVNPDFSSTHTAAVLRHNAAELARERRADDLVSHSLEERVTDEPPANGSAPLAPAHSAAATSTPPSETAGAGRGRRAP